MPTPEHAIADAIRHVTASVQQAIDSGCRSRAIDADDVVEILLAIADRLDPPTPPDNRVDLPCPDCGEADADRLVWTDEEAVRCTTCGTIYMNH